MLASGDRVLALGRGYGVITRIGPGYIIVKLDQKEGESDSSDILYCDPQYVVRES